MNCPWSLVGKKTRTKVGIVPFALSGERRFGVRGKVVDLREWKRGSDYGFVYFVEYARSTGKNIPGAWFHPSELA